MSTDTTTSTPRRRHLMDPAHPVRPVNDRSLSQVQRYVMSTLAVLTAAHMSAAFVLAAHETPQDATAARIGLSIIAGAFAVIAVVAARAIHRRPVLCGWLAAGPVTTLAALVLVLR